MNHQTEQKIIQKLQQPNLDLLAKIQILDWTAHNIPLNLVEKTVDNMLASIGDEVRTQMIKQNFYLFRRQLAGLTLLDLACLEGGLTLEMAREDILALGVEGQKENYDKCQLIKDYFDLPNLDFLLSDVKDLDPKVHGLFDLILCCGLLYHLDEPVKFLYKLNSLCPDDGVLFLDTHIAPNEQTLDTCEFKASLSEICEIQHHGQSYKGRWYYEYAEDGSGKNAWTSVSNSKSFWLCYDDLIRALSHAGFKYIYKPYGGFEIEQEFQLRRSFSRLYLVAVKAKFPFKA